jgi:hypothetical protein
MIRDGCHAGYCRIADVFDGHRVALLARWQSRLWGGQPIGSPGGITDVAPA